MRKRLAIDQGDAGPDPFRTEIGEEMESEERSGGAGAYDADRRPVRERSAG
jgi:hypothetical protein